MFLFKLNNQYQFIIIKNQVGLMLFKWYLSNLYDIIGKLKTFFCLFYVCIYCNYISAEEVEQSNTENGMVFVSIYKTQIIEY